MPGFHLNEMGEMVLDKIDDIGVVDVYDLASDIGKGCEKLIDQFGSDAVAGLMPKVINALELLEALATKNEQENATIHQLNDKISQLECEKLEKAEFRKKFEKDMELIEDQWRLETRELVQLVNSLQDENKRVIKQQQDLQSSSAHSSGLGASLTESFMSVTNDEISGALSDTQILQRLKEQIYKQRNEIKEQDAELQAKMADIENLNIQVERLTKSGNETRRRHKLLQVQVKTLCEERADFLAQLQDQHRDIVMLRKKLGLAEKENEDLVKSQDDNDPNRPRYTTYELKELLSERDVLLTTIDNLTEELRGLKPSEIEEDKNSDTNETLNDDGNESPPEEDPPVQGPMPYEPDDAPWKRSSESGIRKFFRKLFSEPENTFPRRSLSTLSKMTLAATPNNSNARI